MASSLGPEIFSRGFRFNPSPLDATTYYLPRLVAGAPLHDAARPVVHHADVYACEPGELARQFRPLPKTGHRFFFTHCKLQKPQRAGKKATSIRAAGPGSWHSQGVTDVVDGEGAKVGEVRKLRYKKGGAYTDWLMDKFSSTLCSHDVVATSDRQYVLCNIYVSPRAAPDSAARHESAAFFSPVMIAQETPAHKRPAPPRSSAGPPCPKRMRGAVAPMPPAMQPPPGYPTKPMAPPRPYMPPTTASAQHPPPPPTRLAPPPPPVSTCFAAPPLDRSPAPAPPQPTKQQIPPPPLPLVRPCHVPPLVQAPASHCPPQPSDKAKQRTHDPFEAIQPREEEAKDETVAAPDHNESTAAFDEDLNLDELDQLLSDEEFWKSLHENATDDLVQH